MVTITVSSWGSGQFKISSDEQNRPVHKYASRSDPAHAAAEAMNMARGRESYAIFAPKDVLAYIPEKLRCK